MAKAKITITGSGKSDAYTPYAFLYINNTVYTSAQVVEVELGTVCQCRVGRGTMGVVAILLDGNPVKEVTDAYGEAIYELAVNRNYTINLEVATGATITITTGEEVTPDDPMAPHDGHNTNIGNAACEIDSGTVQIGGVLREIESGLVLVNGVAREIAFEKPMVTVSITGNGYMYNKIYASATINGSVYYSSITLDVPEGTEITLTVMSTFNRIYQATININGEQVVSVGKDTGTYVITANTNMTIALSTRDDRETGSISVTY